MSQAVNYVLFQFGWLACILGAASGYGFVGPVAVVAIVAYHSTTLGLRQDLLLVLVSIVLGTLADTMLAQLRLVSYAGQHWPEALAPLWITAMWANFALTIRHSLGWFRSELALASILGLVCGPLAYWGASRLGAVALRPPLYVSLGTIAALWGVAVPALFFFARETESPA